MYVSGTPSDIQNLGTEIGRMQHAVLRILAIRTGCSAATGTGCHPARRDWHRLSPSPLVHSKLENNVVQNIKKRITPKFSVQSLCLKSLWSLPNRRRRKRQHRFRRGRGKGQDQPSSLRFVWYTYIMIYLCIYIYIYIYRDTHTHIGASRISYCYDHYYYDYHYHYHYYSH